ncbi:hypothetical protein [Streptomyces sp. NPDC059452]|uniref:hypothetical protein n=1 Tax=Streptomyces sp. NPDC059452 TaxID=3346835 RepID=UPI003698C297
MPTFQQLLNLRTKPLDSAIDDWVAMTKKLKELAKDAGDMRTYTEGTTWRGENSAVTRPFVTRTAGQFQSAATQAGSITTLLKGLYSELTAAKAELVAIYEAPPYGVKISPVGVITYVDSADPGRSDIDSLVTRIEAILQRAADADARCAGGLTTLTQDPRHFTSLRFDSLKDAKTIKEQEKQTKLNAVDFTPPEKWGSGTIKPFAEFLGYRSWIGGGQAFVRGDWKGAWEGFLGGEPAAAAGEASKQLEKGTAPVGGARPGVLNSVARFGSKVLGTPVAIVATAVDHYYTPEDEKLNQTRVDAPRAPGKVNYR